MKASFNFDQFKDYFEFQLKSNSVDQKGRKTQTLLQLAQSLGYSSPSSLSMIANGSRLPSQSLLDALFEEWKTPIAERERIRLKVEIEKRFRKGKDSFKLLTRLNQLTPYHQIDLKKFHLIRDWYVMVIKLLAGSPDFQEDPSWISQKLRRKVTVSQATRALELLQETGLLVRDSETQTLRPGVGSTETTHDIPSEAIVEHHLGMLERAKEAVHEQKVDQRQFNAVTLQFSSNELPRAKKKILEFIKHFNQEFSAEKADQIYQLNVQLFEHSNGGTKNDA